MDIDLRRSPDRKYVIKSVSDRQREILRLSALGYSNVEVAAIMYSKGVKCTPQNVSDIKNSPVAQETMQRLRIVRDEAAGDFLAELQERAQKVMPAVMDGLEEGIIAGTLRGSVLTTDQWFSFSKYLAGIAGANPVQGVKVSGQVSHVLGKDELTMVKERSNNMKKIQEEDVVVVEKVI